MAQTTRGMIRYKPADFRCEFYDKNGVTERRDVPGKSQYELVDGECRLRGIWLIPEDRRPLYKADLVEADDDVIQFLLAGIANFIRKGHSPIETMKTTDKFLKAGLPMEKAAGLLGISEAWAKDMHDLRKLEPRVLALLDPRLPKAKRLPVTAATELTKIDPSLQWGLAQRVITKDVQLAFLRGEVVRTGEASDKPVRTNEVSAYHRWAAIKNMLRINRDNLEVVQERLRDAKLLLFIHENHKSDLPIVARHLAESAKLMVELNEVIAQMERHSTKVE